MVEVVVAEEDAAEAAEAVEADGLPGKAEDEDDEEKEEEEEEYPTEGSSEGRAGAALGVAVEEE